MTIAVHVRVVLAASENQTGPGSVSGIVDVTKFGAKGDGVADDTAHAREAITALPASGGVCYFPPGTYKLSGSLVPDKPVIFCGAGRDSTFLNIARGAQMRWRHANETNGLDAQGSRLADLTLVGESSSFAEWDAGASYAPGDPRRRKLTPGTEDAAVHFVCTQGGVSGPTEPAWTADETVDIVDGTCVWRARNWSLVHCTTSDCKIENCRINDSPDSGVTILGFAGKSIADGCAVIDTLINNVQGHGVFANGDDGNTCRVVGGRIVGFDRGCAVWLSGFFSGSCGPNTEAVTGRRPYRCDGASNRSVFQGCYHEDVDYGPAIESPAIWLNGSPSSPMDDSSAVWFDGQEWGGRGLLTGGRTSPRALRVQGGFNGLELILKDGDSSGLLDDLVVDDASDTFDEGNYLSQRFAGDFKRAARELTLEGSGYGPAKTRLPGFFLGKNTQTTVQVWIAALDHPAGPDDLEPARTRLWREGWSVWNTASGAGEPWGWRANRDGGWGGGIDYTGRVWVAHAGTIRLGDGIEPSTPTGKVYILRRFEKFISGQWVRDDRRGADLSGSEPNWSTAPADGNELTETLPDLNDIPRRIIWRCFANVGVDWDVGPLRSGTVST